MVLAVGNSKCLCCLEKHHHSLTPWLGQAVSCYEADTCYCPCKCHYEDWWNVFWTLTHASILILCVCVRACAHPLHAAALLWFMNMWYCSRREIGIQQSPHFLVGAHSLTSCLKCIFPRCGMQRCNACEPWMMSQLIMWNRRCRSKLVCRAGKSKTSSANLFFSGTTSEKEGSAISTNMVTIKNSYFKNNVKQNMSNCPTCKNGKTIHLVTMASVVGWFFCVAIVLIDEFEIYIHGAGSLPMFRQRKTESKWIKTTKT